MKTKIIYQGTDTNFAGSELYLNLTTNISDLTGYVLTFKLQNIVKTFPDITSKRVQIILSAQETNSLKLGNYQSSIEVTDPNGKKVASWTDTIFNIRRNPNA